MLLFLAFFKAKEDAKRQEQELERKILENNNEQINKEKLIVDERKRKVNEAYQSMKDACEKNIKEKAEAKQKEKLDNKRMLEEYTAILEKQEKNREEERMKNIVSVAKKLEKADAIKFDSLQPTYFNEMEEKAVRDAEEKQKR